MAHINIMCGKNTRIINVQGGGTESCLRQEQQTRLLHIVQTSSEAHLSSSATGTDFFTGLKQPVREAISLRDLVLH
jgi:hypothetical protein